MKKLVKNKFLGFLLIVYFIIWQISTIFFWYSYSLNHSFWETVFFGFFVAEFKGLFFLFLPLFPA
jgi:hypothetical protein